MLAPIPPKNARRDIIGFLPMASSPLKVMLMVKG
jgi:hypothetical protein